MAVVGYTGLFIVVEIESSGSGTDILGSIESIARCAGAGVGPGAGAGVSDLETVGVVVAIGLIFEQTVTGVSIGVLTVLAKLTDGGVFAAACFS